MSDPWLLPAAGDPLPRSEPQKTTLEGVQPLVRRIGLWPRPSVPDALHAWFFGHPGQHGYALLDGTRIPFLPERLRQSGLPHACLFDGPSAEELADSAYWLVELADQNDFTRSLFTTGDPHRDLWNAKAGVFLRSALPLPQVRAHLRKLTRLSDEQGKWFYLRFGDPLYARHLLTHGSDEMRARLLRSGPMMMHGPTPGQMLIWTPAPQSDDLALRRAILLRAQDKQALKLARLEEFTIRMITWLNTAYGPLPAQIDTPHFVGQLVLHGQDRLGLTNERQVADYVAASWLLRQPADRVLDFTPIGHEIPQATLERIHDEAYEMSLGTAHARLS